MEQRDWKDVATRMFHEHRNDLERYSGYDTNNCKTLALIYSGKCLALSELLEKFDAKPNIQQEAG